MKLRYLHRAWKARLRDQKAEISTVRQFVRRGELAVDAGANKGAYLYWLRRAVGDEGQVVAFEPQPGYAKYLREAVETFSWSNVDIRQIALSSRTGKARFHVPGAGSESPGGSLEPAVAEKFGGSHFECELDSLDHQLEAYPRISFLKVDVEGHELEVFRGGATRLAADQPVILFECERRHLKGHSMNDVFTFLKELGYEGKFFAGAHLLPLERFDPEVHQDQQGERFWDAANYYNNFLFVPRGQKHQ